jgi:Spy/CpxP family protein refolding chaperone
MLMMLMALVLVLTMTNPLHARSVATQDPAQLDPIEQLNLTPEQRQRIRMIFEENKNERQMTNRRVREATVALDQALDGEPIDENLVEQRLNDVAVAQTAQMRMRIRTEMKIRRELTRAQLVTLRHLRLHVRDVMGIQRPLLQRPNRRAPRPNRLRRNIL